MLKILWLAVPVVLIGAYFAREKSIPTLPEVSNTSTQAPKAEIDIVVKPATILQGDPAEIVVENVDTSTVKSLTLEGRKISTFIYDGNLTALVGVDLKKPSGVYPIILTLADGREIHEDLVVGKREIVSAPLGIPEKLGGNTPQAAENLISTLAEENAILASIPTTPAKLWEDGFVLPLKGEIVVTDTYGYTRATVNTSISHKGTDFRAAVGTPVYAMNSGKVALAREFRNYGNTIVIDHGLGLQTLYMHLSELNMKQGDAVKKGELIGRSGMTGYAEFPHLHISVKIGGISIDPMRFIALFN